MVTKQSIDEMFNELLRKLDKKCTFESENKRIWTIKDWRTLYGYKSGVQLLLEDPNEPESSDNVTFQSITPANIYKYFNKITPVLE